jgi:hypothetical protein
VEILRELLFYLSIMFVNLLAFSITWAVLLFFLSHGR